MKKAQWNVGCRWLGGIAMTMLIASHASALDLSERTSDRTYLVNGKTVTAKVANPPWKLTSTWADLIYFPSFGNEELPAQSALELWVDSGVRVISVRFPDQDDVEDSADIVSSVGFMTQDREEDRGRPLFVAGWSRGALAAIRAAQSGGAFKNRPISGLLAFTPPIKMRLMTGLTKPAHPDSTYAKPEQGAQMGLGSMRNVARSEKLARAAQVPSEIPTLIFVAGADLQVSTPATLKWIADQKRGGSDITTVNCPGSKHAILHESAAYGGVQARELALEFMRSVVSADRKIQPIQGPCTVQ